MRPDPLDVLMLPAAGSSCGAAWRGYAAHSLLFYRQNDLRGLGQLLDIGRSFSLGPSGGCPPRKHLKSPPEGPGWGKALAACAQARPPAALRLLDAALAEDPRNDAFYVLRGLWRHERHWGSIRLSDRSLEDFERAVELNAAGAWGHLFSGMAHEMHRRYRRAAACFERAMAAAPGWSWPLTLRGVCRWYQAEFQESAEDFQKAARLDRANALPLLFLARAKADLRDASLVADLDCALRLAPRSGFALSWRGRAMFILDKTPAALADLRRSIRLLPEYDRGYSWLGVSYVELGQWGRGLRLLRKAAALNPYYPTTLYPLARAAMRLGRWAEAGRALKAAAFIDRQGVWVEHRISMSHPNPACLRSLADLDAYLKRRPRSGWAYAWRGQTELLLQNYHKALSDLDAALALDGRDAWAYLWRAEARRRMGYSAEALKDFDRALALSSSLSFAHAGRGYCLLGLGRDAEALRALDRSLALQGRCAAALSWRGQALERLRRPQDARADWEAALELSPRSHWLYLCLWRVRAALQDWEGAARALQALAEETGENSDEAWALLGWTFGRGGQERKALKAFGKALKLNAAQPLASAAVARWAKALSGPAGPRPHLSAREVERLRGGDDPAAAFSQEAMTEYCRRHLPGACLKSLLAGDFSGALERIRADAPRKDIRDALFRGWLHLKAGDYRAAVEQSSRVLDPSLDPACAAALWLRLRAKRSLAQDEAAREDLAILRRLRPGFREALLP